MAKKQCICPIPFHQVFIQSSGKVFPCAFLQNHTLLGDVTKTPLSEIIKGNEFQEFKREHLAGESEQCLKNQNIFSCHKTLKGYKVPDNPLEQNPLNRLDLMIDSHCNLKCIMCTNVLEDRGGFDGEDFWIDFEKHILPHLQELELIGGEPLIIPNSFRVLSLIKKVNPQCKIKLTTNGAFRLGKKVKDALKEVNLVNLGYSIDSLKEDVFRAIRPGGELKQVLQTLEDFISWKKENNFSVPIEVNFVVQKQNAYEVPSFLEFVRKKSLQPYLIFLNYPDEHSLINSPESEKEKLLKFYLEDVKLRRDPELVKIIMTLFKKMDVTAQANLANDILSLTNIAQG